MEEQVFITDIRVNKVRNIENFDIHISDKEKKHLIITGKNGSGKTSLLLELKQFLTQISNGQDENNEKYYNDYEEILKIIYDLKTSRETHEVISEINKWNDRIKGYGGTILTFNNRKNILLLNIKNKFLLSYFEAKRTIALKPPTGIEKIELKEKYGIEEKANSEFIQYIVNLKADRSFAKDDNDLETVKKIDEWFELFEKNLFELFDTDDIQLEFDRKSYNFNIIEKGKEPYNLTQLSDGYSAILSIVTELIMRMELNKTKNYDIQGIVLIDEIETHLHIELQKKILPFLISFFPKIQFIVTTHSPFVITSIDNAVICDLEKKVVISDLDLSKYSYEAIVESYFNSDNYSSILKQKIKRYELLIDKTILNEEEEEELFDLEGYLDLDTIPKLYSDELQIKLQQIKLKKMTKKS